MQILLERIHYPQPYLKDRDGIYQCRVYIPQELKVIYKKTNYIQKTLKTPAKSIAEKLLYRKANEIYDQFDKKQIQYIENIYAAEVRKQTKLDTHVAKRITNFALTMNIKTIELIETTDLNDLVQFHNKLEIRADNIIEDIPDPLTEDGRDFYQQLYSRDLGLWSLPQMGVAGKQLKKGSSDEDIMSMGLKKGQIKAAISYRAASVHSFWQDLFVLAANKQRLKVPFLTQPKNLWSIGNDINAFSEISDFFASLNGDRLFSRDEMEDFALKYADRTRQTETPLPKQISSYFDQWDAILERDYKVGSSSYRKLRKGIRLFAELVGDLKLEELEPFHAFSFADAQLAENPNVSRTVLKDNNWAVSVFVRSLVEKGLIKSNPFTGVKLGKRGTTVRHYKDFKKEDLHKIFNHNWSDEDRLFLSILATTGMRSWEAASLTWEQYNDTEFMGIRYFDLTGAQVKTEGSKRLVPLHPDLTLPIKEKSGRLFSYAKGHENDKINAKLLEMFGDDRLKIHSFRRTLKKQMRDAHIPMEVNHHYIGHGLGDASPKAYLGMSVPALFEGIIKMQHPYLKSND